MIVLDASAVLAAMLAEPGADRVYAVIDESVICSVNAAEVITRLVEKGYGETAVRGYYEGLDLAVFDFDEHLAVIAGLLRGPTRERGLSLGDRACLALAIREKATALTADRNWRGLDVDCPIELIR